MRLISLITFFALCLTVTAVAQEKRPDVFADPQNLKVLPDDISSAKLNKTMKGFAMGLGLRCNDCHVGEPRAPLHTYDFASDEKPMKEKARVMMEMVQAINATYVPKLDDIDPATRVEVRCVTCHRGRPQPKLIQDVLDEQLAKNGLDDAVDKYNALREEFYGSHSYDFSEFALPMYAQGVAGKGMIAEAVALARINTGHFPESYFSFFTLAEAQAAAGDAESARKSYARAVEINPRAKGFIDARIAALAEQE